MHQVLQPLFEPTFSEGSYGFRPGLVEPPYAEPARTVVWEGSERKLTPYPIAGLPLACLS